MKYITLNGIKRKGLINLKSREWWARQTVSIWSGEHAAYWRPDAQGYTTLKREAWNIDFPTAYDHVKHCGPEKQIIFMVMPGTPLSPSK
jgi:hypothetical protein